MLVCIIPMMSRYFYSLWNLIIFIFDHLIVVVDFSSPYTIHGLQLRGLRFTGSTSSIKTIQVSGDFECSTSVFVFYVLVGCGEQTQSWTGEEEWLNKQREKEWRFMWKLAGGF